MARTRRTDNALLEICTDLIKDTFLMRLANIIGCVGRTYAGTTGSRWLAVGALGTFFRVTFDCMRPGL